MTRAGGAFAGKRIVVTGGVGSVGRRVVEQLRETEAAAIRVLDNNESGLFEMEGELASDPRVDFYHCDISDEREMRRTFADMDLCFHAAALKHVPSCERSPFSAVAVNVLGCEVVGRVALTQGLEKVLFTSSDKAVNPTNVMGTSKLMGERLFTAMNGLGGRDGARVRGREARTRFSCVRFGNVAGSRGSVIPLFCRQIAQGGPVTVTDERMTRFVMTMRAAASLVTESMALMHGGEVFITKMPVLRIVDLARVMVEMIAPLHDLDPAEVPVVFTRPRPGEKLWEELSTDEEGARILEGDRFLVVMPALARDSERARYRYEGLALEPSSTVYHSDREAVMDEGEIRAFLLQPDVLPAHLRERLI